MSTLTRGLYVCQPVSKSSYKDEASWTKVSKYGHWGIQFFLILFLLFSFGWKGGGGWASSFAFLYLFTMWNSTNLLIFTLHDFKSRPWESRYKTLHLLFDFHIFLYALGKVWILPRINLKISTSKGWKPMTPNQINDFNLIQAVTKEKNKCNRFLTAS